MVLAHQGGWDEVLFVAGPILVIVLLLALAKRRADRVAAARGPEAPAPSQETPIEDAPGSAPAPGEAAPADE